MGIRVIALQLDDKLCRTLEEVAAHLRLGAIENALRIAAADWVSRRKAEIDNDGFYAGPVGAVRDPPVPGSAIF
jgi:hypothetical protein